MWRSRKETITGKGDCRVMMKGPPDKNEDFEGSIKFRKCHYCTVYSHDRTNNMLITDSRSRKQLLVRTYWSMTKTSIPKVHCIRHAEVCIITYRHA